VALGPGEWAIGRAPTCDVWLDSVTVSRQHARLRITDDGAVLEDLGSRNGTSVRGERLRAPLALRDGDIIQFGSVTAFFHIASPLSSTVTLTLEPKR
jgi:pSer/pThr/pTyr-binding forkhead associated (FHA) protein